MLLLPVRTQLPVVYDHLAAGFVAKSNNAAIKRFQIYQFKVQFFIQTCKNGQALTYNSRIYKKGILINQILPDQIRNEIAATVNDDISSVLFF